MPAINLPPEYIERLKSITAKRPKTVIEHILKRGFITTEELKNLYGYNHAPRAAMDVKDQGIPLEMFKVANEQGRMIAAYRFADPSGVRSGLFGGRKAFSKEFKRLLIELNGLRCGICLEPYEERYLQVDHRVPYAVAGDSAFDEKDLRAYMLLCRSCNRAKSWSCEHCPNCLEGQRVPEVCAGCYWANPDAYVHIALRQERRLDLVWDAKQVATFDRIKAMAKRASEPLPDFVKRLLAKSTHK